MATEKKFNFRIEHVGIHVANMEETVRFYHDIFGFEMVIPDFDEFYEFRGGVFPKCCTVRNGNFELEIYEVQEALPFNFTDYEYLQGVKHISFEIENIYEWIDYIKERGDVEIVVENYYGPNGVTIYILDNSGILVEVTDVRKKEPIKKDWVY